MSLSPTYRGWTLGSEHPGSLTVSNLLWHHVVTPRVSFVASILTLTIGFEGDPRGSYRKECSSKGAVNSWVRCWTGTCGQVAARLIEEEVAYGFFVIGDSRIAL